MGMENRDLCPIQVFSDYVPVHWQAYASPIAADFLGKGKAQVLHHWAFANTILTDLEGHPIWHWGLTRNATAPSWPGIAVLDGDGRPAIVQSRVDGPLRAFDALPVEETCPTCPPDADLTEMNHRGNVRWERPFPPPVSDVISGDRDGDRCGEMLFGSGNGQIYAAGEKDGQAVVEWEYEFGRTSGGPILADLDGDASPEILVPVEDGTLRCLVSRSR